MAENPYCDELTRITKALEVSDSPPGSLALSIEVHCSVGIDIMLTKLKSAIMAVSELGCKGWPDDAAQVTAHMPEWFLVACSSPMSKEEADEYMKKWRAMSEQSRSEAEESRRWSFDNWAYWMKPDQRTWFWWDARVTGRDTVIIRVILNDYQAPWGSLRWLLRAAGASSIQELVA
jgi:hypothetical protein